MTAHSVKPSIRLSQPPLVTRFTMFAGHLGASLALSRRSAGAGLGTLFLAAMLLDLALWIFVLAGVEHVYSPVDFRTAADFEFDFPYSHSLVGALVWSSIGGLLFYAVRKRDHRPMLSGTVAIGAAVFSH